jgi:hypothetical protein
MVWQTTISCLGFAGDRTRLVVPVAGPAMLEVALQQHIANYKSSSHNDQLLQTCTEHHQSTFQLGQLAYMLLSTNAHTCVHNMHRCLLQNHGQSRQRFTQNTPHNLVQQLL